MNNTLSHHPTEEALVDYALHDADEALLEHIEQCMECSEFVEDIRTVGNDIASLDDEPVPERLSAAILAITRKKRPENYVLNFLQSWYKNPFLIGIVTIGMVLLLYVVLLLHL
jgi:hypothetical protein